MYAVSTRGVIDDLRAAEPEVTQVWFADDNAAGGQVVRLRSYWDTLKTVGPPYGYNPKPSKTYLIVKDQEMLQRANEIFAGEGVQITAEGERHIGAALGSDNFKTEYVSRKVANWVKDVADLADIAKEEPQCALSAYNTGLSHRWTFLQRTVEGVSQLFQPLEDAIRNLLIPAVVGRHVSDLERRLLALPYRHGGLGVRNPVNTADTEYRSSVEVTAELTNLICRQVTDLRMLDADRVKEKKREIHANNETALMDEAQAISTFLDEKQKKLLQCAGEKGASSWLSALPLQKFGYVLNKREFRDAICLRYGWDIPETPAFCGCGARNSFDHILVCMKGGYVSMRHNALRDVEAKIMQEVCSDVKVEPMLLPTDEERTAGSTAVRARLDVSARGVWGRCERTFVDVRVTHPTAQSYVAKSMQQQYSENEREKKNKYNDRIINTEKGSFTPLVFSTAGGMGPECERFNKRLAELMAKKKGEVYSNVMQHIRTRLRFALLRSTIIAIRGTRGKQNDDEEDEVGNISFNLVPQAQEFI
jgi:hypothetical protein